MSMGGSGDQQSAISAEQANANGTSGSTTYAGGSGGSTGGGSTSGGSSALPGSAATKPPGPSQTLSGGNSGGGGGFSGGEHNGQAPPPMPMPGKSTGLDNLLSGLLSGANKLGGSAISAVHGIGTARAGTGPAAGSVAPSSISLTGGNYTAYIVIGVAVLALVLVMRGKE